MSEELERIKKELILKPLNSKEELRHWMDIFFDIKFPMGVVYPTSTHGPIDAAWRIYELIKTGESKDVPEIVLLSSRDSFKTLIASATEVLCLVHFKFSIAHAAAILSQSEKAVQYANSFFNKIQPYLEANGWKKTSDNKTRIEWRTSEGDNIYLRVLVMTRQGMNCVSPNAIVETEKGPISAKNININDLVKTYDYKNDCFVYNQVEEIGYTIKECRKITLQNGNELILSDDHQIFTQRGWITADQLKVGYEVFYNSDSIYKNNPEKFTQLNLDKDITQLILGQLLGDASLNFLPHGGVRFQVSHCKEQEQYLMDTKNLFELNGIRCNICQDKSNQIKLTTQVHPIFKEISKITHKNGKKIVSKEWIDLIKEEALAYLIMDDGTINSKFTGHHRTQAIKIATFGFSVPENELLAKKMTDMGYETGLWKKSKYTGIKLTKNSSRYLSSNIRDYFSDCLRYKLLPPLEHVHFTRELDTGNKVFIKKPINSFAWADRKAKTSQSGKKLIRTIINNLNFKIEKIEIVGKQEVIDIKIKTDNEHHKSFLANGILVHNSEHLPMLFMDEIDLIQDPRALEEAKMVPSIYKGYFPLTVALSTRKYSGGLMEKKVREAERSGGEVLRWNIIDITERITPEEARVSEPKIERYISRELPLKNISVTEFDTLNEKEQQKFEKFEAYAGIAEHPMLSVMRNFLVDRPQEDVGDLYKPVVAVRNNFKQTSPEMGEAQLLCNKPSSSGLVYPRFSLIDNAISIDQAYSYLSGEEEKGKTLTQLITYMHNLGIEFYGAADWGNTDETSMGIFAKIAGGMSWLVDMMSAPDMEIPEIKEKIKEFTELYKVKRWFCDSNYPAYIKMIKKTDTIYGKISAIGVKKGVESVVDGITCVQSKIVDANNTRHFKVLKTQSTERVFDAFETYKWKIDGKGDPIDGKPEHGKDGTSDIMDMIRYYFYSMFGKGKTVLFTYDLENLQNQRPSNLQGKISELTGNKISKYKRSNKNKGLVWDI